MPHRSQLHARSYHEVDASGAQQHPIFNSNNPIPNMAGASSTLFSDPNADTSVYFAGGGSGAGTFTTASALPSGLTLNSTTGVLEGTIGAAQGGTYPVVVRKTNNVGGWVESNSFDIVIS